MYCPWWYPAKQTVLVSFYLTVKKKIAATTIFDHTDTVQQLTLLII